MPESDEQQPDSTRKSSRLAKKPRVEYEGMDTVTPPRPMDSEQNSDPTPGTLAQNAKKKDKTKRTAPEEPAGSE